MTNDDDEADDESTLMAAISWHKQLIAVIGTLVHELPRTRNPTLRVQKLRWDDYVEQFASNPAFVQRHLRMSLPSFYKLLGYIQAGLETDDIQSTKGGAILPEISLFCTLRWLAGGSYLDIFALTGVPVPSFYHVCYLTLRLIIGCKELDFRFPKTEADCLVLADGFRSVSYLDAIANCVGAIDGYLLRIITPTRKQAGNVKSFYSGHYQCSGMNIQAVCDHHSWFIFFQ